MQQTQLIQLLSKLTDAEMRSFDKFVRSPYFNSHQDTIRLFEILKPLHPEFPDEKIDKGFIFRQLFPDQEYKDDILRTLRKYLLRQLSYFLAVQRFQEDELMVQNYMLQVLGEKDVHTYFKKQVRHAENQIKKYPDKDEKFFLKQFWIERAWLEYQHIYEKRGKIPSLSKSHKLLDQYFLSAKLELMASELNNQVVREGKVTDSLFSDDIIEHLDQCYEIYPALIKGYYFCVKMLLSPIQSVHYYTSIRTLLKEQGGEFSFKDLQTLYIILISFTNQQYREGKRKYLNEMFEIYKEMLDKELLFEGKIFPVHNYKNIVTLGLRTGNYDWTENFIHKYRKFIADDYQDGIFKYNLAHLYFYQEKYGEALFLMQDVEFLDVFYQLGYKMLQLKIYYEQLEVESFIALAKTYQTHIRRQTGIPDARKEAYYNFVAILRKIFIL
ncbi:MAG: hypothetical protein AAFY45_34005, partial [Bacteroidota bacterium]